MTEGRCIKLSGELAPLHLVSMLFLEMSQTSPQACSRQEMELNINNETLVFNRNDLQFA